MALASKSYIDNADPAAITKMVMQLFKHWKLTNEQKTLLLGLSTTTRSTLIRYENQESYFKNRDTQDRAKYLLLIHKYLRTLFPLNKELVYAWPTTHNDYFSGKTPVEVIEDEGFFGLIRVQQYLENYVIN